MATCRRRQSNERGTLKVSIIILGKAPNWFFSRQVLDQLDSDHKVPGLSKRRESGHMIVYDQNIPKSVTLAG
jgi:hypothetical protein